MLFRHAQNGKTLVNPTCCDEMKTPGNKRSTRCYYVITWLTKNLLTTCLIRLHVVICRKRYYFHLLSICQNFIPYLPITVVLTVLPSLNILVYLAVIIYNRRKELVDDQQVRAKNIPLSANSAAIATSCLQMILKMGMISDNLASQLTRTFSRT